MFVSTSARALTADELLEPEEAFRFAARAIDASAVEVEYEIAEGYYLYRDKFRFAVEPAAAQLGPPEFPAANTHYDKFFGSSEIYRNRVRVKLSVQSSDTPIKLVVISQGCADLGVCYPPQEQSAMLDLPSARLSLDRAPAVVRPISSKISVPSGWSNEEERFSRIARSGSMWTTIVAFLGAGLLLAFTPCVLPMIPILSGIIVGQGHSVTRRRALVLTLAYALGMSVTYTAIGIVAALSGTLISATMQNAWVLGAFSLILVALALSLFGFYEIQLPQLLLSKLRGTQGELKGGRIASVALMGVLSAAIVSPCVAAPLAGALLYISQSGDPIVGGAALFSMAAGMSAPLLVVGVSGATFLPKSGAWMIGIKHLFGILLLALAIWTVAPVVPVAVQMMLWAALLVGTAVFLGALEPLPQAASPLARVAKAAGIIALVAGVAQAYGSFSGADDPLRPLAASQRRVDAPLQLARFEPLSTAAELDSRLKVVRTPVMLDFFADWCVACKEMERFTLNDPKVQARLAGMLLLRADVTANNPEHRALLRRFRLFGPPGIVFFDETGREIEQVRVIGTQSPDKFLSALDLVARKGL